MSDLQHHHEEHHDDLPDGFAGKWEIVVPANSFSPVERLYPQKRRHIISVGFRPSDNLRHNVYPVWLIPATTDFMAWDVCFYNTESAAVRMTVWGIEDD